MRVPLTKIPLRDTTQSTFVTQPLVSLQLLNVVGGAWRLRSQRCRELLAADVVSVCALAKSRNPHTEEAVAQLGCNVLWLVGIGACLAFLAA